MLKFLFLVLATFLCNVIAGTRYTDAALADQVKLLPGAENLNITFNQFSGYLSIDGVQPGSKKMHYWLVESTENPATSPIAFWTNGGPGCSGLLGAMTEQGPFRANADLTLSLNPYAWNQKVNMVFIEQPCGVGFSYSDEQGDDYKADDASAAKDNYALIQAFNVRFPQYAKSPLYITAESYGGHYMPMLAKQIVDENAIGNFPPLNFKGFAVGNPGTTVYSVIPASLVTYWGHQLVSQPMWNNYTANCIDAKIPKLELCEELFLEMYVKVHDLNPYALDFPVCTEDSSLAKPGRNQRAVFMRYMMKSAGASDKALAALGLLHNDRLKSSGRNLADTYGYEPCLDDYMTSWLNLPEVKTALHVKSDVTWSDCASMSTLHYDQKNGADSMVQYYQYLIDGKFGLDILVYSGDDDSVCATVGTQDWIWSMGYEASSPNWVPYKINGQLGGYLTKFQSTGLAFATVHGAGHEVPTYKPEAALWLFNEYIAGVLTR